MICITICRSLRHPLDDIPNREKAISDILEHHGIIENDRLCEDMRIRWGEAGGKVRINIEEWKDAL